MKHNCSLESGDVRGKADILYRNSAQPTDGQGYCIIWLYLVATLFIYFIEFASLVYIVARRFLFTLRILTCVTVYMALTDCRYYNLTTFYIINTDK